MVDKHSQLSATELQMQLDGAPVNPFTILNKLK